MKRHYVDFCKSEPRFRPLSNLHLNRIQMLTIKINIKEFLFHVWIIRAEGYFTLRSRGTWFVPGVKDILPGKTPHGFLAIRHMITWQSATWLPGGHYKKNNIWRPTQKDQPGHLAFFRRTLGTRLGGKRMKKARFEHFGERFEVVWHNINPMKTSVYCE